MSFVFVAYILAAFFTHANWGAVLMRTFVPQLGFNFTSISSAVALLGATIPPYSMFRQAQAEIEQKREAALTHQLNPIQVDVGRGPDAGQLVGGLIMITHA